MEKKKLLVTASTFPRWANDTEPRFVLDLATYMTEEFEVTVLAPMAIGAKKMENIDGVNVIRYHYFPIHSWETLCYPGAIVPRIHEKKYRILLVPFLFLSLYINLFKLLPNFDIVHAHWLIPQGIVQSFFKKPYIVTGHGGDVTALNKGVIKILKQRCIKRAFAVTAVSEALKNVILDLGKIKEVKVISMGCNVEYFGKQFYKENYFNQVGKKVILFVGRLAEKKGVSYLIEAMKNIDAKLVIVGDGPLKEDLLNQSQCLKDKILFLGSKTHEELRTIYASADVFVVPSITAKNGDQEGLGLVILEAMASGLPIIASRSGGIIDLIQDEHSGMLFEEKSIIELENKIKKILLNEELHTKFVNGSKKTLNKYNYKTIAGQYISLLEKTGS